MEYNMQKYYYLFKNLKHMEEFKKYVFEIDENNKIINTYPFNIKKANEQIDRLMDKYKTYLILISYHTGMMVTTGHHAKSKQQLISELLYINDCIPLIAIYKSGKSPELNRIFDERINSLRKLYGGDFFG